MPGRPRRFGSSAEQGPGEPEARQHVVVEPGDRADLITGEGEDEQSHCVAGPAARVAEVGAEGELTVGPGRHQLVGAALTEGDRDVEAGGEFSSLVG